MSHVPHRPRSNRAFSLVELLIALSILMAMSALVTGTYMPLVTTNQEDVLRANLRIIRKAVLEFYNDNGRYPYEGQDEYGNLVAFLDERTSELVQGPHDGKDSYPARRRRYLSSIPADPTLDGATGNISGWKLEFADDSHSNRALPSVRGVSNVRSLNPRHANL